MPYEFTITRRVEFAETDLAGLMHFSNYFRFMEAAEHAFFRSLGFSVARARGGQRLSLPRVHAECDYLAPLRFEDEVEVRLLVEKKSARSVSYQFRLRRLEPAPEVEVAHGRVVVVCARSGADGTLEAVPWPEAVAAQLAVAPRSLLHRGETRPARNAKERSLHD